jgi:glycosyltransferase involved in cell wall biosynthesis
MIEPFDIIMIMHLPRFIEDNWEKIKHKTVIWRTIGQSTPDVEAKMKRYRDEGLKIVRYSPLEMEIPNYIGGDALIRFAKYESDYKEYIGDQNYVVTFGQNVVNRGDHCRYDIMRSIARDYNFKLYGPNNSSSPMNCGEIDYNEQLKELSRNKVYFYSGTWPASYTLNFIEALMSGIPMVALGSELTSKVGWFPYEVPNIIDNGNNGFCLNNIDEIKNMIKEIMTNAKFRKTISENGKKTASKLFSSEVIKPMWKTFLDNL